MSPGKKLVDGRIIAYAIIFATDSNQQKVFIQFYKSLGEVCPTDSTLVKVLKFRTIGAFAWQMKTPEDLR